MSTNPKDENYDDQGMQPEAGEDRRYHMDVYEQPEPEPGPQGNTDVYEQPEPGPQGNTDVYEQPEAGPRGNTAPLEAPRQYPTYPPPYVQPSVYQEPPGHERRRRPWFVSCLFVLLILLVVLVVVGALFVFAFRLGPSTTTTHHYTVGTHPNIVISNDIGTIVVHSGSASNGVTITETRSSTPFGGSPNDIQVTYNESNSGNIITVNVNRPNGTSFFNTPTVDFDVSVPSTTDLQLSSTTGSISINGISGKMSLQSRTGSVSATQVGLTGTSLLKTNTGSVNFNGTIDGTGIYQFQSNTGSINVTLPRSTSFRLNATSDTGSFSTGFPGINVRHKAASVGSQVSGTVGSSPAAMVNLTTNTGTITLKAGT